MKSIAIIGGGFAGLIAAITAAGQNPDCKITIFERLDRCGKKILATGNGRCNLSNRQAGKLENGRLLHYHGQAPSFANHALAAHSIDDMIDFFKQLSMPVRFEEEKLFPYSLTASTVLDVLRFTAASKGIRFCLSSPTSQIKLKNEKFIVDQQAFDRCVIACGGKASPHLGSDGSGYCLLTQFGHQLSPLYPAITQIKTDNTLVKQVKGLKIDAVVSALEKNHLTRKEFGQVLFTDYGLSGPPVLQLSAYVVKSPKNCMLSLDLAPDMPFHDLLSLLEQICKSPCMRDMKTDMLLSTLFHKRLGQIILKSTGFSLSTPVKNITQADRKKIAAAIKDFRLQVTGVQGFSNAQVTLGGILTKDFDDKTMESRLVPHLYAAGEILDITGDCGGYNLQWAFSSGCLAGEHAAKD